MTTDRRLIAAAATLLDAGGEEAVTLRAVSQAAGVSHNAPYKHFRNRNALLAAVTAADFTALTDAFRHIRLSRRRPKSKLTAAFDTLIAFAREQPARYRLLLGTPAFTTEHVELQSASAASLAEFLEIVEECQNADVLPQASTRNLACMLLATVHGLLALESGGHLQQKKGLEPIEVILDLMVKLLSCKD